MSNHIKTIEEMTDNDFIQESIDSVLREAVTFFSSPRFRKKKGNGEMCRYFYHEDEVDFVLNHVPHPKMLKVNTVLNDDKTVFCWVITFAKFKKENKTAASA